MICNNCKNQNATKWRKGTCKNEKGERVHYEYCDKCGDINNECLLPDVSDVKEPYFDEHLCDARHRHGQMIYTRRQKSEVLNRLGLREKRESTIPYIKDVEQRKKYFKSHYEGS
jgi:hypothetical protein